MSRSTCRRENCQGRKRKTEFNGGVSKETLVPHESEKGCGRRRRSSVLITTCLKARSDTLNYTHPNILIGTFNRNISSCHQTQCSVFASSRFLFVTFQNSTYDGEITFLGQLLAVSVQWGDVSYDSFPRTVQVERHQINDVDVPGHITTTSIRDIIYITINNTFLY